MILFISHNQKFSSHSSPPLPSSEFPFLDLVKKNSLLKIFVVGQIGVSNTYPKSLYDKKTLQTILQTDDRNPC